MLQQVPDRGNFPMPYGNAMGLDTTNGWALRSLQPEDVWLSIAIQGGQMTGVDAGAMILHAEGTGDPADTFPDGPISTPPIPFTFAAGEIIGNEAIVVVDSAIETPAGPPDINNWGWWEMDITDPNAESDPHHVVGLWQGTSLVRTAAEWVSDTLLGRDFVGTYAGDAHCLRNGIDRLDGASALALDFRNYSFDGSLDFSGDGGPSMGIEGKIDRDGIHGQMDTISGETGAIRSSLRGFFHGSEAGSLQGAFDASSAANRYIGIFSATGSVTPTAPVRRRR